MGFRRTKRNELREGCGDGSQDRNQQEQFQMSLTILSNSAAIAAENLLNITSNNLASTLEQLSSGSRINTGADDPAGLAIANGLEAHITALTQSASNATDGVGELQVADGALSQVTTLLNRAVTLATESATGTVSNSQRVALDDEYTSIKLKSTVLDPRPTTTAGKCSPPILSTSS